MKSNEFKSGDYIKVRGINNFVKVIDVDTRSFFVRVFYYDPVADKQASALITDVEPIQLNENIFSKLGLNKYVDSRYVGQYGYLAVSYESTDKRVILRQFSNSGEDYWNVHVDNVDMETVGSLDVRYLHQLQQFLYLCNYSLELKSFYYE